MRRRTSAHLYGKASIDRCVYIEPSVEAHSFLISCDETKCHDDTPLPNHTIPSSPTSNKAAAKALPISSSTPHRRSRRNIPRQILPRPPVPNVKRHPKRYTNVSTSSSSRLIHATYNGPTSRTRPGTSPSGPAFLVLISNAKGLRTRTLTRRTSARPINTNMRTRNIKLRSIKARIKRRDVLHAHEVFARRRRVRNSKVHLHVSASILPFPTMLDLPACTYILSAI
jgi:hypothetical protein